MRNAVYRRQPSLTEATSKRHVSWISSTLDTFRLLPFRASRLQVSRYPTFSRTEIRCLSVASYAARVEVRNSLARRRLTAIPCFAYRFSIFGKSTPASAVVALFCGASSPRGFLVLFCRHKKVHKRDIARNFLYNTHGIRTRLASSSENRLNNLTNLKTA